jgi:transcriptional regulator with XRE-family HTH domain
MYHLNMNKDTKQSLSISGEKIKKIRTDQHLSLEDLASSIGTSARYIRKIESGKQKLTISMAKRLALALDVYIDELL